jgi:hypothetical protein
MFIARMIVQENFTVIATGILARAFKCHLISNAALLLDGDGPFLIKFEILAAVNHLIFCRLWNLTFSKKNNMLTRDCYCATENWS